MNATSAVECDGPATKRIIGNFERRNAIAIWVNYTDLITSPDSTVQNYVWTATTKCKGVNGPWMYRFTGRAWSTVGGYSMKKVGDVSSFYCGT